jgi:hypothetical protein
MFGDARWRLLIILGWGAVMMARATAEDLDPAAKTFAQRIGIEPKSETLRLNPPPPPEHAMPAEVLANFRSHGRG